MKMLIDFEELMYQESLPLLMKIFLRYEKPEYLEELENADFTADPLKDQMMNLTQNGYVIFESKEETGTVNRFHIPQPIIKQLYCMADLGDIRWLQFRKERLEEEVQKLEQGLPAQTDNEPDDGNEERQPGNNSNNNIKTPGGSEVQSLFIYPIIVSIISIVISLAAVLITLVKIFYLR